MSSGRWWGWWLYCVRAWLCPILAWPPHHRINPRNCCNSIFEYESTSTVSSLYYMVCCFVFILFILSLLTRIASHRMTPSAKSSRHFPRNVPSRSTFHSGKTSLSVSAISTGPLLCSPQLLCLCLRPTRIHHHRIHPSIHSSSMYANAFGWPRTNPHPPHPPSNILLSMRRAPPGRTNAGPTRRIECVLRRDGQYDDGWGGSDAEFFLSFDYVLTPFAVCFLAHVTDWVSLTVVVSYHHSHITTHPIPSPIMESIGGSWEE